MIENIFYGLTGAWNAVLGLVLKIADWTGSSQDVLNTIDSKGVDRPALHDHIYGTSQCVRFESNGEQLMEPLYCEGGKGLKDVFSKPEDGSPKILSSTVKEYGRGFGEGNPITDAVGDQVKDLSKDK